MVDDALKHMGADVWLLGVEQGTATVAQQKFLEKARRVPGLLSLSAASCAEWGATLFRIAPVMAGTPGSEYASWVSFPHDSKALSFHRHFGDTQAFRISGEFHRGLEDGDWFPQLVELINRHQTCFLT